MLYALFGYTREDAAVLGRVILIALIVFVPIYVVLLAIGRPPDKALLAAMMLPIALKGIWTLIIPGVLKGFGIPVPKIMQGKPKPEPILK